MDDDTAIPTTPPPPHSEGELSPSLAHAFGRLEQLITEKVEGVLSEVSDAADVARRALSLSEENSKRTARLERAHYGRSNPPASGSGTSFPPTVRRLSNAEDKDVELAAKVITIEANVSKLLRSQGIPTEEGTGAITYLRSREARKLVVALATLVAAATSVYYQASHPLAPPLPAAAVVR